MVELSYILEIGSEHSLSEMSALELENFDDVEEWIVDSLDDDCNYNNIVIKCSKMSICENGSKRIFNLVVDVISEFNKNVECIIESNLDIVSDIIYKMVV